MTLFEQTITVSAEQVAAIVLAHWKLKLGAIIKASQNHTFAAVDENDVKFAVRVTPDPANKHYNRIVNEVFFVNFVSKYPSVTHLCAPVAAINGEYIVQKGDLTIIVTNWAVGSPVDFMAYRWMNEEDIVHAWGKWLGEFHKVSKEFSSLHPDRVRSMQRWDEVHEKTLGGYELHPDDEAALYDPQHYGVLHGDLNTSNFFYSDETKGLSVFDWDQTQQGFYLMDFAQASQAIRMLDEGGSLIDGNDVPGINPERFTNWMINGYESVYTPGYIDRERLYRMMDMRRAFYDRFCQQAVKEGNIPKDMEWFILYVNRWFDKVRAKQQIQSTQDQK